MKAVHALSNAIETVIKWVAIVAMVLMSVLTMLEVTRRYLIGQSYPWAEELVRYLLIWLTFLGGSIAWKRKMLVYLNLLEDMLKPRRNAVAWLEIAIHCICLVFTAFIAYYAWRQTFSPVILRRISTGLGISMAYVYFAIPLGFALMSFFTLERLPCLVEKCRGKENAPC